MDDLIERQAAIDAPIEPILCKDCPHFHIDYPPLKGVDFGRASCKKHDLIVDFLDKRKLKWLSCVEAGKEN